MPLIVADTSPIFYLLSINHIDLLPQLFGKVLLPEAVHKELGSPAAPTLVREWVAGLPDWAGRSTSVPLRALLPRRRDADRGDRLFPRTAQSKTLAVALTTFG
jgi:hypothetical protein